MNEIIVVSLEWIDILIKKDDYIYRKTNNDKGTYIKENNKLIINWEKWGEEIFIEKEKNIYYKNKYTKFTINLENESEIDQAELDINRKQIQLVNSKKIGRYKFINHSLSVEWIDTNIEEIFYMYDYGRKFCTRKNSINCLNKKLVKNIAILFPQFHEIPENNKFWGKGFTEWTLLKKLPNILENEIIKKPHDDIGYYNLKDKNHRIFIENLAKKNEIHGFCYYHYWFKNKKIMYEPLELMLKDGHPNLPFMFCWANEQWTKRWDGSKDNKEVLIEQDYDDNEGNKEHFDYLLQYFKHKNYIKINNKPIFIFYRMEEKDKDSLESIIKDWNMLAIDNGFSGIHFMRFLGPFDNNVKINGIEGYVNFEPGYTTQIHGQEILSYNKDNLIFKNEENYNEEEYLKKNNDVKTYINEGKLKSGFSHYKNLNENEKLNRTSKFNVHDGKITLEKINLQKIEYINQHLGIFVGWNNSARYNYENGNYSTYPLYYKNIDVNIFGKTYSQLLENIENTSKSDINFMFISSWNEWNEQNSLEPNVYDGYNYLNKIKENYNNFYDLEKVKKILIISHRGGGTEKYINDLSKLFTNYNFVYYNEDLGPNKYLDIDLIHINSFFTMNLAKNYDIFFKNNFLSVKKILTIHDYQWVYPNDPNILCYNFNKNNYKKKNIENFLELLNICDSIIFPSYNILKNYNEIMDLKKIKNKIHVVSHCDNIIYHDNLFIPKIEECINVAYIGNFIDYKGSKIFKYLFDNIKLYKNYKIKYHVFGYLSDEEKKEMIISDSFIYHNQYKEDEIIDLLFKFNIHIITHLSLFEESYCYALTHSINSGIPILYLNHGAFSERMIKNDRYFPTGYNELLKTFDELLLYIIDNNGAIKKQKMNKEIQYSKWYLNNY